jgi:3-methylcrotonyl-CoA carboxylase alpha subunit
MPIPSRIDIRLPGKHMLKKLLIANRGEIACRIIRTARKMGIATVAVYSDADAKALHVRQADEAVHIGASPATESYLRIDKIIAAAKATDADAIHPGYGFLSENADLPEACVKAGIRFVGPRADAMRALGGKAAAKDLAIKAGVPVVPGYQGKAQDVATLMTEANRIGYPVMIKAVAGGGGRGMRLVEKAADFAELFDSAKREATSAFGNPDVLIEKVVVKPRHIEVQVFGDTKGNVVHLFERDCTLQRRNQKVIEEAPAPGMSDGLRAKMCDAAVKLAKSVNYEGAGTVEFLVEGGVLSADAPWYFIEMNTRLQVEHPVTEEITGLDLVEWQLRVAAGEALPLKQADIKMSGHAIEVRLCAEDPANGFMPSVGTIQIFHAADDNDDLRIETGVADGSEVSPFYDSMIAKLIITRADRADGLVALARACRTTVVAGPTTNQTFLATLLSDQRVGRAQIDTGLIGRDLEHFAALPSPAALLQIAVPAWCDHRRDAIAAASGADPASPWGAQDGFQLGPARLHALAVAINGVATAVDVTWDADGAQLAARADDGHFSAYSEHHPGPGTLIAIADGRQVILSQPTYDASAIEDTGDGTTIRAPINGRVAKIFVKPGDVVEKGARIATVEAMKMEHVVAATATGTVGEIAVAEGAQVVLGAIIASVVPA